MNSSSPTGTRALCQIFLHEFRPDNLSMPLRWRGGGLIFAKLILAKADVLTVSRALELALFYDGKIDVTKT
jgi:hypothetical protein